MQVNIGKAMIPPAFEISLKNVGDNVLFHDERVGKIVSVSEKTFPKHPFTIDINGNHMQYDYFGNPLLDSNPVIIKVISRFSEKKIIQISTAMIPETERGAAQYAVTALCDDGSVYVKFNDTDWEKLPPIPKD